MTDATFKLLIASLFLCEKHPDKSIMKKQGKKQEKKKDLYKQELAAPPISTMVVLMKTLWGYFQLNSQHTILLKTKFLRHVKGISI